MIDNFNKSFDLVIGHEGGFSNDQRDKGNHLPDGREGSTMLGCTQYNWENYINKRVTQDDMKKLLPSDVKPYYKRDYWDAVAGDLLPSGIDYAAFDFAINAGANASRKFIQSALGVNDDGIFGPVTLASIHAADEKELLQKFTDAKSLFYINLNNPVYIKGWLKRVADVQSTASQMIG
jgi:lysozyme family protein